MLLQKNSKVLIQKQLSSYEIKHLIAQKQKDLSKYLGTYCNQKIASSIEPHHINHFIHNYQLIIIQLNKANLNINNFSMHFLITLNLFYRALKMQEQAKQVLKKSIPYLNNNHSDPLLQAICLNNLANIYKSRKKYWKCLKYSLRGVEMMQMYMQQIKELQLVQKQESAIVLVSLLIYCKKSITEILKQKDSKVFRRYYEIINYLGYRNCKKYLGVNSIFNKFTKPQRQFKLPVFKIEPDRQQKKQSKAEEEIVNQLQKIYELLKNKQDYPLNASIIEPIINPIIPIIPEVRVLEVIKPKEVIKEEKVQPSPVRQLQQFKQYFKEETPSIVIGQTKQKQMKKQESRKQESILSNILKSMESVEKKVDSEIISKQQSRRQVNYIPSQSQQQSQEQAPASRTIFVEQTIIINKKQIIVKLEREPNEKVGKLTIELKKGKIALKQQISPEKLQKIINQINKEDRLPYEMIDQTLIDNEFIEHLVKPFINIDHNKQICFYPRSFGLFEPFMIKFINQDSFVFVNHIRNNMFRIALSPLSSSKSIYINIELTRMSIPEYFFVEEEQLDIAKAILGAVKNKEQKKLPQNIKEKYITYKVTKKNELQQYLNQIIKQFEGLLINQQDETSVNQIIDNQLLYYKYQQISKEGRGIFYIIRYLPSINYFSVYLKNNYETYSNQAKQKARGFTLYKAHDFIQDFGIPLKASKDYLFAFMEIIVRKYYLLIFQKSLTQNDLEKYVENAILTVPITQNCFRIKHFKKQNYYCPITISLVTINSEIPVGIKIVQNDPIGCKNRGFFIHLVQNEWVRPYRKPAINMNTLLFKTYVNQFPFKTQYFIAEWLEKKGFQLIYIKIFDPQNGLYFQSNINGLIRGTYIVQLYNESVQDSK